MSYDVSVITADEERAFRAGAEAMREIILHRFPRLEDINSISVDSLLVAWEETVEDQA